MLSGERRPEEMAIPNIIFPVLRERVKEREDSAKTLATDLEVSYWSILNKLSGKTSFTLPEAIKLSDRYNTPVDDLFRLPEA